MKTGIVITIVLISLATGCKYDGLETNAIITGYDGRQCACCGGLMINFENQTQSYIGSFYLIDNSGELGLPSNPTFPIYAAVTYTLLSNTCGGKHIHINSIRMLK